MALDSDLMLIAIMNNMQDFYIAQTEHWYRIPVKSAPANLEEIKYIAFYFTRAFGKQKWSILYWAEVKEISIVKRSELLPLEDDHPRAKELYYKIKIGELRQLSIPIASKRGRRIVFIITTLEKFRTAKELNDLFHGSPLEDRFWEFFKRGGLDAERQYYVAEERKNYCLDFAIFCDKGMIDVECNGDSWHSKPETIANDNERNNLLTSRGWSVLRFSTEQIEEDVEDCLDTIRDTIDRFGGISSVDGEEDTSRGDESVDSRQLELF